MREGLLRVQTFVVPVSILEETIRFLREVGSDGYEGFVLWSGTRSSRDRFQFTSCVVPKQRAMHTESGLLVTVDGQSLFDVNKVLHERDELLAAQVHSHPTEAYHSSTDDTFPLVTILGGLSLVIPDFASNAPADFDKWAWYRLSKKARWEPAGATTSIEFV